MLNKGIFGAIVFGLAICCFFPDDLSAQCAMCKAVVESAESDGTLPIGKGLNKGILYLMGIPYILLFFLFRKKLKGFFKEFFQLAK